jgi:hypothetical protein
MQFRESTKIKKNDLRTTLTNESEGRNPSESTLLGTPVVEVMFEDIIARQFITIRTKSEYCSIQTPILNEQILSSITDKTKA